MTLQNPFLEVPQVESPQSRSWALGFAFGFQGPAESSMAPTEIAPEDADAFDQGVLAGQDAAINGLEFPNVCVDLHSEGPSVPHLAVDGTVEGGLTIFELAKGAFAGALLEGVLMVVMLSISLETFSDDPDEALAGQASALQRTLQRLGIENSMELFLGGAVDTSNFGCELMMTPVFRTLEAASASARGLGRPQWIVTSWRTDQSNSVNIVASSSSN